MTAQGGIDFLIDQSALSKFGNGGGGVCPYSTSCGGREISRVKVEADHRKSASHGMAGGRGHEHDRGGTSLAELSRAVGRPGQIIRHDQD
jgi:hypothetical protein